MHEVFLIARREYLAYVGAWGFWLSLATAPLMLALFAIGPLLAGRAEPDRVIALIAENPSDLAALRTGFAEAPKEIGPAYVPVDPPASTPQGLVPWLTGEKVLESGPGAGKPLFAAIFVDRSGEVPRIVYWSTNLTEPGPSRIAQRVLARRLKEEALSVHGLAPQEIDRIEALKPMLEQFDPRAGVGGTAVTGKDRAPFIVGMILSIVLWSTVIGVANMLLTGVIEEKSNKILDSLLTSATPLQILAGKLSGVAAISGTLFLVWGLLGALAAPAVAQAGSGIGADIAAAALNPVLLGSFLLFFLGGYLTFGAIFLGLGALCDSLQEAQSLLGPIVVLLTLPVMLIGPAFQNPEAPLVVGASWFPLFTPFVMMMRAPAGLSLLELVGAIALMGATVAGALILSARLFRAGVVNNVNAQALRNRIFGRRSAAP